MGSACNATTFWSDMLGGAAEEVVNYWQVYIVAPFIMFSQVVEHMEHSSIYYD